MKIYSECLVKYGANGQVPLNLSFHIKGSDDVIIALLESYPALEKRLKDLALLQ